MDNKEYSLYCSSLQTNVHDSESTWLKLLRTAEWHSMLSTRKLNSPLGSASIHCASSARFSKGSILRVNRLSETCRDAPFREDNQPTGPLTADQPGLDVDGKNRQLHQQDTSYPLGFKQTEAAEALQGMHTTTYSLAGVNCTSYHQMGTVMAVGLTYDTTHLNALLATLHVCTARC